MIGMKNITIYIPDNYEKNIQNLIEMKLIANRSEAIRTAIREFLQREYFNLKLLNF
ncbi:MAG: ribbon-helix-helix domain-containing protein [Promethearchaeota archaeon]